MSIHKWSGFSTIEWRPHDQWVLQASGMQEGHSFTGSTFSPRFAANFHVVPDHTVRAGIGKSHRAPNFYELYADTRAYSLTPVVGTQVAWSYKSSGTVKSETLITNEIGYLGNFRQANLKVDLRAFVERINNRINAEKKTIGSFSPYDFVNRPGPHLHGFEYQLDWQPIDGTRLIFSELHIRSKIGSYENEALEAPRRSNSVTWFQQLPNGFDFSIISTASTPFKWGGGGDLIDTPRRLDVRMAKRFLVGATRGEFSVTGQAVQGQPQIYNRDERFQRRAFANLKLEF
jgi:iron complex outermembrane receptor protein